MSKTVLVTGGAGYIGSLTCKQLKKAGYLPVVYDDLSVGHAYAVKWGPLVEGNLRDSQKLEEAFSLYKPSAVIHFAASAIVSESVLFPEKYYRNNVEGTLCLLESMCKHRVKKLIFSSTCATYGFPQSYPLTEEHPIQPVSPYGKSKWMSEEIIRDFEKAHQMEAVILRYFNAAGADLDLEVGEHHNPETHLIPSAIEAALGMRKELVVYGNTYPSADGSALRDFIHILDLAEAHIAALKAPSSTLNLGTGQAHSVLDVIQAVEAFGGRPISKRFEPARKEDPAILIADPSKAKKMLDWTPQYSDLKTIVESAWKWHEMLQAHGGLIKAALKC